MTEPNAGASRDPRDPDWPPAWEETPGSSVFDRSPPAPAWPPPPPRPAYPPTPQQPGQHGHPEPTRRYDQPPVGWPSPAAPAPPRPDPYAAPPWHAGGGAYAPGREQAPPRRSQPPPGRRRANRPGGPAPDRGDRAGRGGGGGLPFGAGALVGVAGIVCVVLSLMVLPWFTVGGEDVTLPDIRDGFAAQDAAPDEAAVDPEAVATTLPDGIPSAGEVQDIVEDRVREAAAEAVTAAVEEGKARYLEVYASTLWLAVIGVAVVAVVLSTMLSPRSAALSLLVGFRFLAGFLTLAAGAAHGAALWAVFSGDAAPAVGVGAWLGLAGLAGVLLACAAGPKR